MSKPAYQNTPFPTTPVDKAKAEAAWQFAQRNDKGTFADYDALVQAGKAVGINLPERPSRYARMYESVNVPNRSKDYDPI